mmetsp:Transcript_118103/g.252379  ORF Transcript_118103/g.252379 Transcript_118103/m.252379 type:complete len:293 (-) Transcript_118103:705-1583(-)
MEVASFLAVSSSAISFSSVAVLCVNWRLIALPSSTAALNASMVSLSLLRVTLFFPNSSSQKPSCLASSLASSRRRVIMVSMSLFTLANGSAAIFSARRPRLRLCKRLPSAARKSRTLWRKPALRPESKLCRSDVADPDLGCAKLRYFSALPETSGEERISTALAMASISSVRSFCFSAKDNFFSVHSVVTLLRVCSLSALTVLVEASCFVSRAAFATLRSFSAVFSSMSLFAFSMAAVRSWTFMSEACFEFISSFWVSPNLDRKSSFSFLSKSTIPPDWNSYALACGASRDP